jgi:NADPH:quinone reductase-like Zn-dependent oxidoreductase
MGTREGMRAVIITKPGGPDVLAVTRRSVRAPGPGEVRIAVKAAAVNPTDVLMREDGARTKGTPGIPGMDAAGIIESVGAGVERLKVGDEVMAVVAPRRPEGGAQIELLVLPESRVVAIPSGVTLSQASTLPMNGLTALLALVSLAGSEPRGAPSGPAPRRSRSGAAEELRGSGPRPGPRPPTARPLLAGGLNEDERAFFPW